MLKRRDGAYLRPVRAPIRAPLLRVAHPCLSSAWLFLAAKKKQNTNPNTRLFGPAGSSRILHLFTPLSLSRQSSDMEQSMEDGGDEAAAMSTPCPLTSGVDFSLAGLHLLRLLVMFFSPRAHSRSGAAQELRPWRGESWAGAAACRDSRARALQPRPGGGGWWMGQLLRLVERCSPYMEAADPGWRSSSVPP